MKKILNWTFGGFFRAFGRILCFLVFGGLIAYLIASNDFKLPDILTFGITRVKADSVSYNYSQYRTQYYQLSSGTSAWNNWTNFGTSTALSNGYGVSTVAFRFGLTQKFQANTNYRVVIEVGYSPSSTINETFVNVETSSIVCAGSSTSTWSSDTSLIESCTYLGAIKVSGTNHVKYVFDVVPTLAIYGFQFNIPFSGTSEVSSLRAHTSSEILTGNDVGSVIEEQTLIIQDGFNDITNIINQTNEDLIEAITENNKVCRTISVNNSFTGLDKDKKQNSNGSLSAGSSYAVTPFIKINSETTIKVNKTVNASYYQCFFDSSYNVISCTTLQSSSGHGVGSFISVPSNASYVRFNFPYGSSGRDNIVILNTCDNGNQAVSDELHGLGQGIHDNDTSEATSEASDFFNSFSTNTHGLTSIITAPLNAITSLNSSTCTPLHLPIPYLENKFIDLPCMRTIYDQNFGGFMNLYDTIIFGIVSYWIIVRIFGLVKDFKNPEHDEIEVVDL